MHEFALSLLKQSILQVRPLCLSLAFIAGLDLNCEIVSKLGPFVASILRTEQVFAHTEQTDQSFEKHSHPLL